MAKTVFFVIFVCVRILTATKVGWICEAEYRVNGIQLHFPCIDWWNGNWANFKWGQFGGKVFVVIFASVEEHDALVKEQTAIEKRWNATQLFFENSIKNQQISREKKIVDAATATLNQFDNFKEPIEYVNDPEYSEGDYDDK